MKYLRLFGRTIAAGFLQVIGVNLTVAAVLLCAILIAWCFREPDRRLHPGVQLHLGVQMSPGGSAGPRPCVHSGRAALHRAGAGAPTAAPQAPGERSEEACGVAGRVGRGRGGRRSWSCAARLPSDTGFSDQAVRSK
jgi:hypothetical protein